MSTRSNLQPRHRIGVVCIRAHRVPPPIEFNLVVTQGEKDDDRCESGHSVHGCLQEVYHMLALPGYTERKGGPGYIQLYRFHQLNARFRIK